MMRTVKLISCEDPVTGTLGLKLRGVSIDDDLPVVDTSGLSIAHDLMEHQNGLGRIGTIIDELEALGGILFVRGIAGQLGREPSYRSIEDNIGSGDLSPMFERIAHGAETIGAVPVTHRCDLDDMINACIGYFSPNEVLHQCDVRERHEIRALVEPYKQACLSYMRIGYRKARKRWGNDNYRANRQFWAIADAVKPYAEHVEAEGQRFKLQYGMGKARAWEVEDDGACF